MRKFFKAKVYMLLLATLLGFVACDQEEDLDVNMPLYGHWTREIEGDEPYTARLVINENQSLLWVVPQVEGHQSSGAYFELSGDELSFTSDSECGDKKGVYHFEITGDELVLTKMEDESEARASSFEGKWKWIDYNKVQLSQIEMMVNYPWAVEKSIIDGQEYSVDETILKWIDVKPDFSCKTNMGDVVKMSTIGEDEFLLDFQNELIYDYTMKILSIDTDHIKAKFSIENVQMNMIIEFKSLKD
uniref:hypothetical protein n=1 Tax=uncultured Draconibacterium sp. TaxID=1573823 RepID=UPI0032174C9C